MRLKWILWMICNDHREELLDEGADTVLQTSVQSHPRPVTFGCICANLTEGQNMTCRPSDLSVLDPNAA